MKANELRVTNFVLNDGVVNAVIFIGYDSVQLITKQGNNITAHLDLIKPIPLTEEWLLSFGFHEKYHSTSNHWTKKAELVNAGCELIDPEDEKTDKLTGVFYYSNWGIDILYVHQLQNLFFALTGEELELKQ